MFLTIGLLAKIVFFYNWLIGAYPSLNNAPQLVPGINNCGDRDLDPVEMCAECALISGNLSGDMSGSSVVRVLRFAFPQNTCLSSEGPRAPLPEGNTNLMRDATSRRPLCDRHISLGVTRNARRAPAGPSTAESIACSGLTRRSRHEKRSKSCGNSDQSTLCKKVGEKAALCHNYEALATE